MKILPALFLASYIIFLLPCSANAQTSDFMDMSSQTGFNATGFSHGVAIGDFNLDGLDDIYVSRTGAANLLYLNKGNFHFEEAAATYGTNYTGNCNVSLWVDIDQDHDLDLFVGNSFENNVLYRNDGNNFTDVSEAYGIQTSGNVRSLNAVDFDNDGDMDIYVAVVLEQNILWRNDGDHFTNVISSSGIDIQGRSLGAVFFDYDNDGDQDLYQGQDGFDGNFLYRNNGDGTFTDVTDAVGLTFAGFCMGATVGDINYDGIADIYIENLDSNRLWVSNGIGSYNEISTQAGVADIGMGWSAFFFDYDNNALLDIYLCNDSYFGIPGHGKLRNRLFVNQGNLTFTSEEVTSTIQNEFGSYGCAYADFDLDGKLDLVVANESPVDGNQLFRNIADAGNYIAFELEGTESNYQAIGSRVVLYDQQKTQTQYVIAGSGYSSQNSLLVQFGLGDVTSIDSVVIYWPSGLRQQFGSLSVNQRYHAQEGNSILSGEAIVRTVPIDLYPTLIKEDAVVYGHLPGACDVTSVLFSDLTGRNFKIDFTISNDGGFTLRMPEALPAGVYIVSLQTVRGNYVGKVMKQ
ncbi:MAG TPA: CRTAC1 family protein [Saprospiraceae bacterium]|nr:CRTAC1 family protein [Saprospiraceae bacterium]